MVAHFRCVASPTAETDQAAWVAQACKMGTVANRCGIDGFVFRYDWENDAPNGVDIDAIEDASCKFLLCYTGNQENLDDEHVRFLFTTLMSPNYLRVGNSPVVMLAKTCDVTVTRSFINRLRQLADGSGIGKICVVLEETGERSYNAFGFDIAVGHECAGISAENTVDLINYRAQVAGAIVQSVRRAEDENRSGALVFVEVSELDEALLKAHYCGVMDAAEELAPIPSTVGGAQPSTHENSPESTPVSQTTQAAQAEQADKPSLSVATVTTGNPEATMATIMSVAENTSGLSSLDFTVVDNGSTDATRLLLAELGDSVIACRNDEPVGAQEAWAQAFSGGEGEYVLFVSNDVVVSPGWFEPLMNEMRKDPKQFALSCCVETAGKEVPSQPPTTGSGVCLLVRRHPVENAEANVIPSEARLVRESKACLQSLVSEASGSAK